MNHKRSLLLSALGVMALSACPAKADFPQIQVAECSLDAGQTTQSDDPKALEVFINVAPVKDGQPFEGTVILTSSDQTLKGKYALPAKISQTSHEGPQPNVDISVDFTVTMFTENKYSLTMGGPTDQPSYAAQLLINQQRKLSFTCLNVAH